MSVENFVNSKAKNDTIDIDKKPEVTVKILHNKENKLSIQLEGNSVNTSVSNAIRRAIMLYVPIYGFHRSDIKIENKKSHHMYNNDMISMQIESLPIYDIPNDLDLVNPEEFASRSIENYLFGSLTNKMLIMEEEEEKRKIPKIVLSLNYKNKTDRDHYVSTHDMTLKINGKESDNYLKHPSICILVIKPGEDIYLSAEASLGIAAINSMYEATTNVYHIQKTPSKFEIHYETLGQLDQIEIFKKACRIIIKKLENLLDFVEKNYPDANSVPKVEFELYGEEHTIGKLITDTLKKSQYVSEAAYAIPHPGMNKLVISYVVKDDSKKDSLQVFRTSVKYLVKLFKNILVSVD